MEQTSQAQCPIDLFADESPTIEQIQQLCDFVNSSEANQLTFAQQVEEHLSDSSAKAMLAAGVGFYILGKPKAATDKLKLAKTADCPQKYLYLGLALRKLGQYTESIESLQKALDHGADSLMINLEKAATCRCAKDFEAAQKHLNSCENFENVNSDYHYQLARLQEAQGLYEQAINNYETAIELCPDHQKALFHLAYRCDLSGNEQAAIDYYKQIASKTPVYVSALLNLAVLYEDEDEFEKAIDSVDKVLRHHPNHQRALLFKKDIDSSMTMYYDEEKEKKKDRRAQILETPISDFELSVRSRNCLKKMNIRTLEDLLNITEAELLSYKNFGETSLREIKNILTPKNLHLGMALEEKQMAISNTLSDFGSETEFADKGLLSKPIEDLQLSVRARKCVGRLNLRTLGQLTQKTEAELLGVKNFGVTSLNEIKKALDNIGLSLRILD